MIPAFVPHPDPEQIVFTENDTWQQVDLSSLLYNPMASGVALRAHNIGEIGGRWFGLDVDSWTIPAWNGVLHVRSCGDAIARLIGGKIWLRSAGEVEVFLMGEFQSPGMVFYSSPVDMTPTVGTDINTWRTRWVYAWSQNYRARDVEAVLVQCITKEPNVGTWGLRRFGSSYAETFRNDVDWRYLWAPAKTARLLQSGSEVAAFELYTSGIVKPAVPDQYNYCVGYILKGYGFEAAFDPFELDADVPAAWTTIPKPTEISPKATGVVARLENRHAAGYYMASLRTPGTAGLTPDIERLQHNSGLVAALASDQSLDYFLESPSVDRIEILAATTDTRSGEIDGELEVEPRVRAGVELEDRVAGDVEIAPAVKAAPEIKPRVDATIEVEPRARGGVES